MSQSVSLIGLPGSGKSTIGVQLAKHLGYDFLDTDILIQKQQGKTLQTILDTQGHLALRRIEAEVIEHLRLTRQVIATGGSAVYGEAAMKNLKDQSTVVYLRVSPQAIHQRINNEASRGIARAPGQSLDEVIAERLPLYERYADIVFDNEQREDIEKLAGLLKA